MTVFVTSSAIFALMVRNDPMHAEAKAVFNTLSEQNAQLVTSSYVLFETLNLLWHRVGKDAVHDFQARIMPLLDTIWVDSRWHQLAMLRMTSESTAVHNLTDCLSLEIMESYGIEHAFAFDHYFMTHGLALRSLPVDLE